MTTQGFKRKLTAILHADIEGYRRLMGENEDETISLAATFDKGLKAYRSQHWDKAEEIFTDHKTNDPNDKPTQIYLRRVAELKKDPPPKDWDGIYVKTTASET
jgi:adenylate cyclase